MPNTASLTITREIPADDATTEDVWISLEQKDDSSDDAAVTVTEAANVVDAVYDLDPCDDEYTLVEETEETEQPGDDEIEAAIQSTFDLDLCDKDLLHSTVTTTVYVYQSDPTTPYRLQIEGGTIKSQVRITDNITEQKAVEKTTTLAIGKPVITCTASWMVCSVTPAPKIQRTGNTLFWSTKCSGTIIINMLTNGDQLTISSPMKGTVADGSTTFSCAEVTLYAFQAGASDMLTWTPATDSDMQELAELQEKYCSEPSIIGTIKDDDTAGNILTIYIKEYKCQCSGNQAYTVQESAVDLYSREYDAAGYTGFVYKYVFAGYVDCGEETGDINDPEFYKEKCCEYPPHWMTLPNCSSYMVKNAGGASLSEETKQSYRDSWAGAVRFVAVSPADGDCGTTTYNQELHAKDCCDEVETDLAWVEDSLPEVLPHGGSVLLFAEGGLNWEEYTWKTSAKGTYFANGKKTISAGGCVRLYAEDSFCGMDYVYVTDGCTSLSASIRSDEGYWKEIEYTYQFASSVVGGQPADNIYEDTYYRTFGEATNGKYKLVERVVNGSMSVPVWNTCSTGWLGHAISGKGAEEADTTATAIENGATGNSPILDFGLYTDKRLGGEFASGEALERDLMWYFKSASLHYCDGRYEPCDLCTWGLSYSLLGSKRFNHSGRLYEWSCEE